jgi:Zn-dependent protease
MDAQILALSLVILLFSVIVHEVMHGFVALKFGDHTAQRAGRLTLNPLSHIDPIGTILVPGLLLFLSRFAGGGFLIGWAKPVPVNPLNFTNIRKGELFVSLAGIASNFALALVATLLYHLLPTNIPYYFLISEALIFAVRINLTLAVFNLLPIPPLDGSNALLSQLPLSLAQQYEKYSYLGPFIILGLLYFNILGAILGFILVPLLIFLGIPL